MQSGVIVSEPRCRGFVHANFNAALLSTVLLGYPESPVTFAGEREHSEFVRAALTAHYPDLAPRVSWLEVAVPAKKPSRRARLAEEERWCDAVTARCRADGARLLVLCSVTAPGLVALKSCLRRTPLEAPLLAVMHGILSSLEGGRLTSPTKWGLSLRSALQRPHPPNLRYMALGEPIFRRLSQVMPEAAPWFVTLDMPGLWAQSGMPQPQVRPGGPVRLGHFGEASKRKGLGTLCRLAAGMRQEVAAGRCQFEVIGFLRHSYSRWFLRSAQLAGTSSAPLTADEYTTRARGIDYAIATGALCNYGLTASATFLDALSYVKPGIYLRSPFVEHYFERMGDIGYLCDDYRALLDTVRSLAADFPRERYLSQCENILRGRSLFEPGSLAPRLREIVSAIN